tara:strand:- start:457 stop:621 length:165 start_codon:yes stop_codon:yes gene_type:complete
MNEWAEEKRVFTVIANIEVGEIGPARIIVKEIRDTLMLIIIRGFVLLHMRLDQP